MKIINYQIDDSHLEGPFVDERLAHGVRLNYNSSALSDLIDGLPNQNKNLSGIGYGFGFMHFLNSNVFAKGEIEFVNYQKASLNYPVGRAHTQG
jgi:hypothetical protein